MSLRLCPHVIAKSRDTHSVTEASLGQVKKSHTLSIVFWIWMENTWLQGDSNRIVMFSSQNSHKFRLRNELCFKEWLFLTFDLSPLESTWLFVFMQRSSKFSGKHSHCSFQVILQKCSLSIKSIVAYRLAHLLCMLMIPSSNPRDTTENTLFYRREQFFFTVIDEISHIQVTKSHNFLGSKSV